MKVFILLSIAAVAFGQDCGVNQHFTDCGTSCPLTCENYKNPPKFCNLMCNIGCECDEGFVRTKDGSCVAPQQCPQEAQHCGVNQHFTDCGTSCPLTCENYKNPPKFCNLMCKMNVCECDAGFVQLKDGRCVDPRQCPEEDQLPHPAPAACLREKKVGPCKDAFRKYFYNKETGECEQFYFGGCLPNSNNFDTQEDCEAACKAAGVCQQEKVSGPCRAAFRNYFYNKESGKCEFFYYGGCQGNFNRFNTLADCEDVCGVKPSAPSACQEEKVVGPCRAAFRRYFFNKQTGECEQFIYGGCEGNSNNFNSQEDCEAVCLA